MFLILLFRNDILVQSRNLMMSYSLEIVPELKVVKFMVLIRSQIQYFTDNICYSFLIPSLLAGKKKVAD